MINRRYPTAEEVERIMCYLEHPMTENHLSHITGVDLPRVRFAMRILSFRGLVTCSTKNRRATLWTRRGSR